MTIDEILDDVDMIINTLQEPYDDDLEELIYSKEEAVADLEELKGSLTQLQQDGS